MIKGMKFYCFILCISFSMCLHAQHPIAWNIGKEDGLPSLEVYDLYQDSKGYIWMGTDNGLCKYNGKEFFYYKNKEQLSNAMSAIQEDAQGRIWGRNFKNQVFYVAGDSLHYFEAIEPLKVEVYELLVKTEEEGLYIVGKSGDSTSIYEYDPARKEWKVYPFFVEEYNNTYANCTVFDAVKKTDNELYIHANVGVFKLAQEELFELTGTQKLKKGMPIQRYKKFYDIGFLRGQLLLEGKELYLRQYVNAGVHLNILDWKYENENFILSRNPFRVKHQQIVDIIFSTELPDGSHWLSSKRNGIQPINSLTNVHPLFPSESISDIIMDQERNYWVSTLNNGVYFVPQLLIHAYESSVLTDYTIESMDKDTAGNLLLGTQNGVLWTFNSKTQQWNTYLEESPNELIYKIKSLANNKLLVMSSIKVVEVDILTKEVVLVFAEGGQTWRNMDFYDDNTLIRSLGKGGIVLSNFRDRAQAMDSTRFPTINIEKNFKGYFYKSLNREIYAYWVLMDQEQERFFTAWTDSLICYPERGTPIPVLGENKETISAAYLAKSKAGHIWACTVEKGIYIFDKNLNLIKHLTTKDGLISNEIIKLDFEGEDVWLLTKKGVQCYNPAKQESRLYTLEDGLPTLEINDIKVVSNQVWLNTAKGLISFDINMPSKNETPPPIYIKRVAIHDKDTSLSKSYTLDYTQNALAIYVEGLSYKSRGNFSYAYRMLGIDSSWTTQSSQIPFIRYPQLNPGNYTFEVVAVNEDGVRSKEPARITFMIYPPYWRTWWFQTLGYLVVTVFIVRMVQSRQKRKQEELERKQEELKRKQEQAALQNLINVHKLEALQSQMNPHFIFNVLTAVQNLWLQSKNELAMSLQSNFAKLLRKIFQYSSKQAISIEQVEEFLQNYLKLEQIRFENQVEISFEVAEDLLEEEYYIPPLLIQPIIENSFKHGLFHKKEDRKLWIHLKKAEDYLWVCVEDNGVGRSATIKKKTSRSSGLQTAQERLKILQATIMDKEHPENNLKITDLKDESGQAQGTRTEMWIPFVILGSKK